ncbi:unnamed protein product [Camellia sinensis]
MCLFSVTPHPSALLSVTGAPPRLDEHTARVTEAPPSLCLGFRMFSNEDVTIGGWMLAMNVNHEDNRQLCEPEGM